MQQYDATELVKTYSGPQLAVLIDQGRAPGEWLKLARQRAHPRKRTLTCACHSRLRTHLPAGTGDNFYPTQLQPEAFAEAAKGKLGLELRMQEGYDHSYYFISYVAHRTGWRVLLWTRWGRELCPWWLLVLTLSMHDIVLAEGSLHNLAMDIQRPFLQSLRFTQQDIH